MTIIKQIAVTNDELANKVQDYLTDENVLLFETQLITYPANWFKEMERTRIAFGHDEPARAGAKNTIMYHQILAFLPEECSCNGGKMTPEKCMQYAREWIEKRYPEYEIAIAIVENIDEQGSRYSAHIAINRSNLETGKRLHEGRADFALRDRVRDIRTLDAKWKLRQVVRGAGNSKIRSKAKRFSHKEQNNDRS